MIGISHFRRLRNGLDSAFFVPTPTPNRLFSIATLAALYLLGLLHWSIFFQFGQASMDALDWNDGIYYFSVVRDSISDLTIPYFVEPGPMNGGGARFLGNPQSAISPQLILTPFMSAGYFILANTLIMYSVGFIGCLLLRARYHLALLPFVLLFLLFNFNGHITSHLSVGHTMWYGYFLLPFFFYLLLELIRPSVNVRTATSIFLAFVLFGIVLQGSFHIFVFCLVFLAVLALVDNNSRKEVLLAIALALALSAFRLVPTAFVRIDDQPVYASGFPTLATFIDALTTIKAFQYEHPSNQFYNVGWYELDHFVGYVGLGAIIFYGIYHRFSNNAAITELRFKALDIPLLLMVLISFGFVFDILSDLRLPLLSFAERVPSRFFILPLIGLAIIGAIRLQALLPTYNRNLVFWLLAGGAVIHLAHSLIVHSDFWRLPKSELGAAEFMSNLNVSAAGYHDTLYLIAVRGSAVFSLASVLVLGSMATWLVLKRRG